MTELAVPPAQIRRVAYLGTPELAVAPLQALIGAGVEIPVVITQPDRRRGRGSKLTPSPVSAAASAANIAVSHDVDAVLSEDVDLAVVVAFGRLIRPDVLAKVPMINSHFSLLPRWRGAAPIQRALLAGDSETGVCLMRLAEGLDTGAVYRRDSVPIGDTETAAELTERLVAVACRQLVEALANGLGQPQPQEGEPSYAAKLKAAEFELDFNQSAEQLNRWIRVGGAWTTMSGQRFKIWTAIPLAAATTPLAGAPGELVGDTVACGHGALRLVEVQPSGKPRMSMSDWVNGRQPPQGFRFG